MKTLGFIASAALLFGFAGTANAETFETVSDPSGVAMCFAATGAKAPLAKCQQKNAKHLSRTDPAGGVMCFDTTGKVAPILNCATKPVAGAPAIGLVARIARLR